MENTSSRNKLSRRQAALSLLAGTAAAPLLASQIATDANASPQNTSAPRRRESPPETPPFGQAIEFERKEAPRKVNAFALSEVRITGGPCKEAQELNLAYLKRLDNNRLLHNFRVNAGLPSSAQPLGGWEKPDCELRGHFVGHFLSACALMYASTGDQEIKSKGDALVASLAECQQKLGGGYLSAFPTEYMERLKMHKKVWAPFYTYHKIMAGMLDMHHHAQNQQALAVVEGMAKWVDDWTAPIPEPQMQSILNVEYGGMNEVLYTLAFATGNDHYAAVGDRFTKKWFFNPLALRRDQLRGLHTNTHIPQVIGAARRYELSSEMRFHDVADAFWHQVVDTRTYVSGGTSDNEGWLTDPNHLAQELSLRRETNECCCAYNMMKLARKLYTWTADPRIFDYYERNLYNHRLGTIVLASGHTQYFLALGAGSWRTFGTEEDSFWCCNGTGVEEFSKLADSIYFHDENAVYVNLFIPSDLDWKERGVRIRQTNNFPAEPRTSFEIIADAPKQFALKLRIPAWVRGAATISINGKPSEISAEPGSYLVAHRNWRRGDRVELTLPMDLHVEAMPDDPGLQAFLYGPLVLASRLDETRLPDSLVAGFQAPDLKKEPPPEISPLTARDADIRNWRHASANGMEFELPSGDRKRTFVPFNSIGPGERYSIYWKVV